MKYAPFKIHGLSISSKNTSKPKKIYKNNYLFYKYVLS